VIDGLKPYPKYRDSGVPWLGNVPEHWDVRRNGRLFAERREVGFPDLPVLEVSLRTGVQVRNFESATRKQAMGDRAVYKRARAGDIAYNMMRMWQGAVGVAPVDGLVSPAYVIAKPFAETDSRFFEYLFRTPSYMAEVNNYSRGIVADRNRLYWDEFKDVPSPAPPREEQALIVRFLRNLDRRIGRYVRAKKKLIGLLNEQKQAIVYRAVTRGVGPNVRLKPSGVDWLGEVPEHWELRRLKFLAEIKTGGRDTADRKDDGVYPFFVRSQKVERIDSYVFEGEAVLTAGDGAGVARVFHYVDGKFDYHQRVYKFSEFRQVSGKFFFHYFSSTLRFEAFRRTAKSTVDSLRLPMLQNFPVVLPPRREQDAIVRAVENDTRHLDSATAALRTQITLLREFHTRLTSDVVMGKLDLRDAAVSLSDAEATDEPTETSDTLEEFDEELDVEMIAAEVED
jgi:type I restriction enzyme S subunit